ncbi:DUF1190 domain-containing protein [Methylobacterium sp. J-043]|nr:DUF1190 domain-containing protein [Methylobacterium sp. J-043]
MADERETSGDFARRSPSRSTPAVTPPDRAATKRSQTVSTVLVAGAGLAALSLGGLDRTAPGRDVLVYADVTACTAEAIRTTEDCRAAYDIARAAYPSTAPHYVSLPQCEQHHGSDHCALDRTVDAVIDPMRFVPRMAGYLLGRTAAEGVTPEPVYDHSSGQSGHHGAYCTGSGGRITTGSGSHASSGSLKSGSAQATKFGGFGSSGRGFSSFGGT